MTRSPPGRISFDAVDLMILAGPQPVAAICAVVGDDGEMMRLPALVELGDRESAPVATIEQLIHHLGSTTR